MANLLESYKTLLFYLSVPQRDIERNVKSLADLLGSKQGGPRKDALYFLKNLIKESMPFALERMESLWKIGQNPYDEILLAYCIKVNHPELYDFAWEIASQLNGFFTDNKRLLTPADLIHPSKSGEHEFSFRGAYYISASLKKLIRGQIFEKVPIVPLGDILSAFYQRRRLSENTEIATLVAHGEALIKIGWREFFFNILLPLRKKISSYFII